MNPEKAKSLGFAFCVFTLCALAVLSALGYATAPTWAISILTAVVSVWLVEQNALRAYKFRLRKWTTPVHWAFGLLCVFVAMQFFPAGLILLVLFGALEAWDDWCHDTREGEADWWDSFATFSIGFGAVAILNFLHVVSIRWWI